MALAEEKRALRAAAKARRGRTHEKLADDAGDRIGDRFLRDFEMPATAVVAGYWPFGSELNVGPLLARLHAIGHICALPAVTGPNAPLAFHEWHPGDPLLHGRLGEPTPLPAARLVTPDILLVPLLAFDRRGFRLGYGGGHYDRTLRALRAERRILAVGVAYADQEVESVPHGDGDEPLDWVITERETIPMGTSAPAR